MKTVAKLFIILPAIAVSTSAIAQHSRENVKTSSVSDTQQLKYKPGELRQKLDHYMGGIVEKPSSSKGWICIANAQSILPEPKLHAYIAELRYGIKLETKVQPCVDAFSITTAANLSKKTGANATLFLIEDDTLPFSLVAPESGWAVVNARAISKGTLPRIAQERVKKAIIRAYSILCGAYDPGTAGNILWPVSSPEDYDSLQNPSIFPPTLGGPICAHMSRAGMSPIIFSSYRKACEAGWAPTPTNDMQKAIWDEIRSLPQKPIKIEFDPAKGK